MAVSFIYMEVNLGLTKFRQVKWKLEEVPTDLQD
jgi:hypothetical protein